MTPERWRQVEELYRAARELPAADRERVLREAAEELRDEVELLLAQDLASVLTSATATIPFVSRGTQLGSYRIESPLGSGGPQPPPSGCPLCSAGSQVLRRSVTSPSRACLHYGLGPSQTGLGHSTEAR
jgi:hypothetical protein